MKEEVLFAEVFLINSIGSLSARLNDGGLDGLEVVGGKNIAAF